MSSDVSIEDPLWLVGRDLIKKIHLSFAYDLFSTVFSSWILHIFGRTKNQSMTLG